MMALGESAGGCIPPDADPQSAKADFPRLQRRVSTRRIRRVVGRPPSGLA
jgi:hypothetical protein